MPNFPETLGDASTQGSLGASATAANVDEVCQPRGPFPAPRTRDSLAWRRHAFKISGNPASEPPASLAKLLISTAPPVTII